MQFIIDGPEIPENLLNALEDDELVFFCGAGVSMQAGLPSFAQLVDKIYRNLASTAVPSTYNIMQPSVKLLFARQV
jgi:NAD-dependent SIR2 family protein deacetylase